MSVGNIMTVLGNTICKGGEIENAGEWELSDGATCRFCIVTESIHSTIVAEFHLVYVHLLQSLRAPQGKHLPLFPTEFPVSSMVLVMRGMLMNERMNNHVLLVKSMDSDNE